MLVALGYCAPLQRLRVANLPRPPVEGATGRTAEVTVTCDAPLVALGLSDRGYPVDGHFSATGRNPAALALTRLIETKLKYTTWGQDSGDPLELQIVDQKGQLQWYSDPSPGLRSLASLVPPRLAAGDWLYLDDFAWLSEVVTRLCPSFRDAGLYVNLGRRTHAELRDSVARWREQTQARALVIQCSVAAESRELLQELAIAGCRGGAALMVVTGGDLGLALASPQGSHAALHQLDGPAHDSAGAGSAVAISVLQTCLNHSPAELAEPGRVAPSTQLRKLAEDAARAGAEQCLIDGAVEARLRRAWQAELYAPNTQGVQS